MFSAVLLTLALCASRASGTVLRFGFFPASNGTTEFEGLIPTANYLNNAFAAASLNVSVALEIIDPSSQPANPFYFFDIDLSIGPGSVKICQDIYDGPLRAAPITSYDGTEFQAIASLSRLSRTTSREVDSVCGIVVVLDGSNITKMLDLKGRIVEFTHPINPGAGILQLFELLNKGLDLYINHKQLRFNNPEGPTAAISAVLSGAVDAAFVRMDFLDQLTNEGRLSAANRARLRIVEPLEFADFPYNCSTQRAPDDMLYVNPRVSAETRAAIVNALLSIPAGGAQATAGNYYRWVPALSTTMLQQSMSRLRYFLTNIDPLGIPGFPPAKSTCPLPNGFFPVLQCPLEDPNGTPYYKLSAEANARACAEQGTPCPAGYECLCSPCQLVPSDRFLVRVTTAEFNPLLFNASSTEKILAQSGRAGLLALGGPQVDTAICDRLSQCGLHPQGTRLTVIVNDLLQIHLDSVNLPLTTSVSLSLGAAPLNNPQYNMTQYTGDNATWHLSLDASTIGSLIIQLHSTQNGVQQILNQSPFVVDVVQKICPDGLYSDLNGTCIARSKGNGVPIGVPVGIPVAVGGLCFLCLFLALPIYRFLEARRWRLDPSELELGGGLKGDGLIGTLRGAIKVHLVPLTSGTAKRSKSRSQAVMNRLTWRAQSDVAARPDRVAVSVPALDSTIGAMPVDPPSLRGSARAASTTQDSTAVAASGSSGGESTRRHIRNIVRLCNGRHPNLAIVFGYMWLKPPGSTEYDLHICEEYSEFGTLGAALENRVVHLEISELLSIAKDVASAMQYLHSKNPLVHGCLGPNTVLLSERLTAKVSWRGGADVYSSSGRSGASDTSRGEALSEAPRRGPNSNTGSRPGTAPGAGSKSPALPRPRGLTVDQDVYDFGILLIQMFFRWRSDEILRALAESTESFQVAVRSAADVPVRVQAMILDCLEPKPELRPPFSDLVRSLEHLSEAEGLVKKGRKDEGGLLYDRLFPRAVAEKLKRGEKVEPMHHPMVTVLFSDIVGFTEVSSKLDARDIQGTLDAIFTEFDMLAQQNGVFRLEIIGDAYVCTCNLEEQYPDHTARICRMAAEMVATAARFQFTRGAFNKEAPDSKKPGDAPESYPVRIRVGVHAGPVVSTVLGLDRPRFTLIGDTMNTGSRCESTSLPMHVQLSDTAAHLLTQQAPDLVNCLVPRGKQVLKGKGEMHMYFFSIPDEESTEPTQP